MSLLDSQDSLSRGEGLVPGTPSSEWTEACIANISLLVLELLLIHVKTMVFA